MEQLFDEEHDIIYTFNYGFLNKESIVSLSHLLVSHSIKTGDLVYPSLKYLKKITSNQFSKRSVDSLVKTLVQLGILQRLPRKKQQPYQLQLNLPLLRFLLTIYYSGSVFAPNKFEPQKSNLSTLFRYKDQLNISLLPLYDIDSYIESISDTILNIIDSYNSIDELKAEIEEELFWAIIGSNSSDKIMKIAAETNQARQEGN